MTRRPSGLKTRIRGRLFGTGALFAALLLLSASAVALNIALSDLARSRDLVGRNNAVLERLAEVENTIREAETGQRGYLLTGEPRYLAPYRDAVQRVWGRFDRLGELVRDPAQADRLGRLRSLTEAKLRELAETVALRADGFEAALAVVRTDLGQRLMEEIEADIRAFREEQQHLLDRRVAAQQRSAAWATGSASFTGILALASAILGAVLLVRETSRARLIESEERFRNLAENIQEVFWISDPSSRKVLYANPAFERVWGLPRGALYADGTLWAESVLPEDRARVEAAFAERAASGGYDETYRIRRRDGALRWIRDRGWPVRDRGGALRYVVGVADDISEIMAAQDALARSRDELEKRVEERTARLAELNRELDAFAYSISHDLRAPLRAMHGYADALVEDYGEALPEEGRHYVDRIAAAAVRMDRLIQDILAYSRLTREELPLRRVSLEAVVDHVLARTSASISDARAEVEVDRPLPEVRAHMPTLVQAVENLVSNALKFRRPDRPPHVRIGAERRGAMVRVRVEDEGIGLDPSQHERIFRPFERLHGVETYPGSGIGLAIVRKSIERMGGACGVESNPGAGSRFWFELPAAEEDET